MKLKYLALLLPFMILASCTGQSSKDENLTQYINVRLGSGGHGHVFVGASVPFGMVQVGPTSIPKSWDWCSGYHASDSTVIGFSHTHLEGTGCGDLYDITIMPVIGDVTYARGNKGSQESGLWSYADRTKEVTKPGYYSVPLMRYGITAEMTSTNRVGVHRYTFPQSDSSAIVVDLENGGAWDKTTGSKIEAEGNTILKGYRYSDGWAKRQRVFFYMVFEQPFDSLQVINDMFARACFKTTEGEQRQFKVAISPVSVENAKLNLETEAPGWDFDKVAKMADAEWNKELSRVKVTTDDADAKTIFYTAMFHTMIHPSTFCDVNNDYRGADDQVYRAADFTNYTTYSLWDTYRALMPLFTITQPDKMDDMVNTMVHIFNEQGKIPVWHLWGWETDCMVGNPGVISVGDAIVKGYKGFDTDAAYAAMKASVMLDERGQDIRKEYGHIPSDLYNKSIANDMEYAIADGAVAHTATFLGKDDDAAFFTERSHSYRYYMDPETKLARGRFADGSWRTPFNPFYSHHDEQDYCEGNAWQYTWLAPQDFDGLVDFYGSNEELVARLDTLFAQDSRIDGEHASGDISGLIGQYVHGNEPSHHIIYFYTMAGAPGKTAEKVREVYNTMYFNDDNGLSGNEDAGQMSAWYILSSLGFYQVEPASTRFWFGSPLFDKAEVKVAGGTFEIVAEDNSEENIYIQSITLNGAPYSKAYIDYYDIVKGGKLVYKMGPEPKVWF